MMTAKKNNNKRPNFNAICAEAKAKKPRVAPDNFSASIKTQKPSWQIAIMDFEGDWGWHKVNPEQFKSIQEKLKSFESMTWGEIEKKRIKGGSQQNHTMSPTKICKEAYNRLVEIQLDDIDSLYSLRLSGVNRLWGIRRENGVFKILWWDPEHSIYPVKP